MAHEAPAGVGVSSPAKPMKIYFCDICNESIPLKDINSNRITIDEGKIFCSQCAPKKARAGEKVPMPLLLGLLLVLAGLIVVTIVGAQAKSRLERSLAEAEARIASLSGSQATQGTTLDATSGRTAILEQKLAEQQRDLTKEDARIDGRIGALEKAEQRHIEELRRDFDARLKDQVGGLESRLRDTERLGSDLQQAVNAVNLMQQQLEKRLDLLQDIVAGGGGGPARPGVGPEETTLPDEAAPKPAPADPTADKESQEIADLVAKLSDEDPGVRFSTIVELSHYRASAATTAVERMLKDPVDYVRKMAVRALTGFASKASIPHLIETLRDSDYFVRAAARDALRGIAGTGFGYDPDGSATDRERKVKEWEKWWDANKASLLGG